MHIEKGKRREGAQHHPRHMTLTRVLLEGEAAVWLPGRVLASGNDPLGRRRVVLPSSGRGPVRPPLPRRSGSVGGGTAGVGARDLASSDAGRCSFPGPCCVASLWRWGSAPAARLAPGCGETGSRAFPHRQPPSLDGDALENKPQVNPSTLAGHGDCKFLFSFIFLNF